MYTKNYYLYSPDRNRFDSIYVEENDWNVINAFNGSLTEGKKVKKPNPLPRLDWVNNLEVPSGDFPSLSGSIEITFSKKAMEILFQLVHHNCQFIPLDSISTQNEKFSAVNILTILDCFDEKNSEYHRNSVSNNITYVRKWVLKEKELKMQNLHIFRVKPNLGIFVSQEFKNLVEKSNLEGLIFSEPVKQV